MELLVKIHFTVHGKVQGVGFRYHTRTQARALGIVGTVKNCSDGSVEVIAEGENSAIDRLLAWCKVGPEAARVSEVKVLERSEVVTVGFRGFEIGG